jgi:hypothetical protein
MQERLKNSAQEVLLLWLVEIPTRWIGRRLSGRLAGALASIGVASPPVLAVAASSVAHHVGGLEWFIAADYSGLLCLAFRGGKQIWPELLEASASLDQLAGSTEVRALAVRRFDVILCRELQIAVFVVGIAFSALAAMAVREALEGAVHLDAAYVVTIAWTGGIGAMLIYWLWVAPTTVLLGVDVPSPCVDWLAPLETPGIRQVRHLMIKSIQRAGVGLVLFTIPIGVTVAQDPSATLLQWLAGAATGFSLCTVLFVTLLPLHRLSKIAHRGKVQALDALRPLVPLPSHLTRSVRQDDLLIAILYERAAAAPTSLVNLRRLVESGILIAAQIASVIVPVLLAK